MDIQVSALAVWRGTPVTVSACGGEKISIIDADGNTKSVRPKDIEVIHPGPYKGGKLISLPPPDWQEIIDLAGGEVLDFAEWTELAWGVWSPESAWSGFLVLQEKLYWEGDVSRGVRARSPEDVAAVLAKKQAKDAKKEAFNALVARIASCELLPEDELPLREVFAVARGEQEKSNLMEALGIECVPRQAHRLLLRCGACNDTFNPHPARNQTGYPGQGADVDFVSGSFDGTGCSEFAGIAVAIDAASSNDPDDALSPEPDGSLWVHVADPADIIADDSAVDQEAMTRGVTLYLPEGTVPMLPAGIVDVCGLGLQEKSHALSLHIDFNADGSVFLKEFRRTELSVSRMTYEEAEVLSADTAWQATLANLTRYSEYRASRGGVELTLPEFDIFVDSDFNISLCEVADDFGRTLVRNAMVAAGNAVAKWAVENNTAMPFAVQNYAEDHPEWEDFDGSWVKSFERRQFFLPTSVSAVPGMHAGLGVEPYVRVTSPLRRYGDLLAHRQLLAILDGREPLSADELERRLCYSEEGAKMRRNAERDSKSHWMTVYMKRLGEWQGRAVKLGEIRDKNVFLLPELGLEVRSRWGTEIERGAECTAVLKNADIPECECKFDFRK